MDRTESPRGAGQQSVKRSERGCGLTGAELSSDCERTGVRVR